MSKIISFFKNHILGVVLFFICVYICYANYTPGTFLTGWDTLHPEFNYRIYLGRILDGVWQEHQSLGAVATQAHASEIPRVLVLMLLDLFLPMNMVRYAYAFLMLILGPLGVYAFVKHGVLKDRKWQVGEIAGFAGGLFYLFNLCTLQHFYVPLEMFLTHFGLLGWLFLTVVWFLREGSRKALIWFSVVTFFMVSQAHTATLFYAFFLYLILYLLSYLVAHKFNRQILKRVVLIITGTIVINLFWFPPNLYFAVNHGKEIQESKIHLLFSQEAFLQNKEFGNIKDVALLKSFLFNWGEYVGNSRYGDLLDEWRHQLQQPLVLPLGYGLFGLVVVGLALAIAKREKVLLGIGLMFLAGLFFIFNVNPPLGGVFVWLQDNIPLFKEAFRFPFTKFSIGLVFCYAVFFSYFISVIAEVLEGWSAYPPNGREGPPVAEWRHGTRSAGGRPPTRIVAWLGLIGLLFLSFYYYAKPMFKGGLISPSMRIAIPQRYFEMFSYFDSQKDYGRVLNLPIHSMWGWVYHNWDVQTTLGYQGAGFLWFGIKQPLINREFDRWNLTNEKPYMEISTAIYARDLPALEKLLDKYKIRWLLVDKSIVAPAEDQKQLFYPQIEALLASSQKLKLEKDFGQGLAVYKYFPDKDFVLKEKLDTYYIVGDDAFKESTDPIYTTYGNYAGIGEKAYPFVGITNYDESVNQEHMSSDAKYIYFNNKLTFSNLATNFSGSQFQYGVYLVSFGEGFSLEFVPVEESLKLGFKYDLQGVGKLNADIEAISINNTTFSSAVGRLGTMLVDPSAEVKVRLLSKSQNLLAKADFFDVLENCSQVGEQTSYSLERATGGFVLSAQNVDACVTVELKSYLGDGQDGNIFEVALGPSGESRQEVCVLEGSTGLCLNPPLYLGRTFFTTKLGEAYNLRFFARGKKATSHEIKVNYTDISLYKLTSPTEISFKPAVSLQKDFVLSQWKLEKDLNYSGNASKLVNFPRFCNGGSILFNKSKASVIGSFGTPFIRYESSGQAVCDSFEFPSFSHQTGAVLEVRSRNLAGMPLRVCLTNEYSKRCDLYVSLAQNPAAGNTKQTGLTQSQFVTRYFLIPPMGEGRGYTLNFSNLVFGDSVSINDLEYVALTPFPYDLVRGIHKPLGQGGSSLILSDTGVDHIAPASMGSGDLVVYNQAYEKGWVAFCGLVPCRAEHVVVNNWANGWVFPSAPGGTTSSFTQSPQNVPIFFWPQILEYLGFGFLVGWFVFCYRNNFK